MASKKATVRPKPLSKLSKKKLSKLSKKKIAKLGNKIDRSRAMVILRRGGAIDQAKILEKSFTFIQDGQVDPVTIAVKHITTIILRNLPLFPLDVIRFPGNEMSGKVTGPDPVHLESVQVGGKTTKQLAEILTIIF